MNYKFNLDFITKQFAVDNEIKLYKNTNLIDKFYFEVFSNLNPRKLIMTFRGFDKVINFNIFLKNNLNENGIAIKDIFTGVFTVDKRMTKEVFTSYLIFEILDDMNNSIGTSTRIPIKIVNSMITDDCGGQIGIIDHRNLQGREYPEQHPANSIVGAKEETVEEDLIKLYDNLEENKEEFLNQIDILNQNLENEINILSDSINLVEKDLTEEILKVEKESKERDTTLQENINNEEKIRQQNDKILNDKISVENRERINEDRILGERIDDLTQSTNDNFENIKNDFDEKLEKEKQERIAEDLKLENKKIDITQIGNTVAPLGKDNLIPRNFLPETLFKSFKYFENIIDRDSSSPIDDDWCYVNETTKFYVFKEDNWKPITLLEVIVDAINITFNNQDTIFTGSNVQIVIQEISNLFKENNLNLENIIKDIEKLKEDLKNEIQARKDEDKKIIDDLKIVKLDFEDYKNETNIVTNDLTSSLGNLENLKLDKTVFENYKNETNKVTNDLTSTIGNLETDLNQKISEKVDETKFEATLKNYVKEIKIKDDILTTDNSLIDLTDKIKSFVTAVTLELGTSDQIQLLLDKLEEHINSDEPHNIIKIKLEELQTNLINFKDLLLQQITTEISDHNNSETAHSDLFNKLKDEINLILDDLKTELLEEINQIKLDIVDIQTAIETINQKFEDLDGVVSGSIDDIDIKITNHNNSETAHPFIQNKITNLNSRVDKLEPKAIFISQNSIQDFIDNNPEANKIQSGNLIIFKNAEEQVEIYQFFTTSSIVETKTSDGWDNIDNYVPLQQEIKLQNASTTDIGVVGIGNNINIDSNGFIYLDDASETGKGLVQLGTLEELEKSSTTKVFTGKIIKDYFLSKIPVSATNADVATGTDNAKYITPATLPIKSVTTGNGLTLTNNNLSLTKQWVTSSEVANQINSSLPKATQTIEGVTRFATQDELNSANPPAVGVSANVLKKILKTSPYGLIKQADKWSGTMDNYGLVAIVSDPAVSNPETESWGPSAVTNFSQTRELIKYYLQNAGTSNFIPNATTTQKGIARIATEAEAQTGTDNSTIITPFLLKKLKESGFLGGVKRVTRVNFKTVSSMSLIIGTPRTIFENKDGVDKVYFDGRDIYYEINLNLILDKTSLHISWKDANKNSPYIDNISSNKITLKDDGPGGTIGSSIGYVTKAFYLEITEYY